MVDSPSPLIRPHTRRRRLVQPLWTALEHTLDSARGGRVVLAVSGGSDSRALMEAVARWPLRREFQDFLVITIDHGIRPTSAADADAVGARARALGFDAERFTFAAPSGGADESRLRALRYEALVRAAKLWIANTIVVAHHQNDVAEGFLLSALGLTQATRPMAASRILDDGVTLCRPFLALTRGQLRAALAAMGGPVGHVDVEDARQRNHRAHVRQVCLPALEGIQPQVIRRLSRGFDRFSDLHQDPTREST